jgi:outer membrane protein insertion porin family/translocation and assembly module TamA
MAWAVALLLALQLLSACCGANRCFLKRAYPAERFVISEVVVSGNEVLSEREILEGLATTASPRFLFVAQGVGFDYEVFDETLLASDLERIERLYRTRGYYEAKVTASRVVRLDRHHVRVEIEVDEGPPDPYGERDHAVVLVRQVNLVGLEKLPPDPDGRGSLAAQVIRAVELTPCLASADGRCNSGEPFEERAFQRSQKAIGDVLANRGFAFVVVKSSATVDITRHVADVTYEIDAGPLARFGPVTIEGLEEIPEHKVRAQLSIREGRLYSRRRIEETRAALTALGRFSNVEVVEDMTARSSGVVPVRLRLKEGRLRGVRAGVGASFDVLKLSNSLLAGWENRNFLGGMRELRLEDRFSLTYYPLRIGRPFVEPTRLLPENYFNVTLRQPAFLERRTEGVLRAEVNVFPILYRLDPSVDPDRERIIGFLELRGQAGLERGFLRRRIVIAPSYSWSENWPVRYQTRGPDPAGLGPVRVIYPELLTDLDFRDDPNSPRNGVRLLNTIQLGGAFGLGDVSDVRINPDLRLFYEIFRDVTLAVRGSVGLLFPENYGDTLRGGAELRSDSGAVIRDQARLLFRVFYSGGPNSNRGYPFRGIGPHGPLGFLQPATVECSLAPDANNPPVCDRPLGGLTAWEASTEVRFPIAGALGGVTFIDASDVTRERAHLRATSPHLSPGFGIRYATPVGPVRFDIGFRAVRTFVQDDPATPENERDVELGNEPDPGTLLGLPMVWNISIGQAF